MRGPRWLFHSIAACFTVDFLRGRSAEWGSECNRNGIKLNWPNGIHMVNWLEEHQKINKNYSIWVSVSLNWLFPELFIVNACLILFFYCCVLWLNIDQRTDCLNTFYGFRATEEWGLSFEFYYFMSAKHFKQFYTFLYCILPLFYGFSCFFFHFNVCRSMAKAILWIIKNCYNFPFFFYFSIVMRI